MKIHSVTFEGFMLFKKKTKRVFADKDIIGIIAEYANNPDMSNKGGKSTFVEMILWCLFGISRAERNVELIHRGADKAVVEVVLVEDGVKTKVLRGIDSNNKSILEINGIEKKKEAQTEINKIIGMNAEEVMLTNYFRQNDINKFMELKPAEKKTYLMRWLKNNHWKKLEEKVLADLTTNTQRLSELKSALSALDEMIVDEAKVRSELKDTKVELEKLEDKITVFTKRVAKLNAKVQMATDVEERLERLTEQHDELAEEIESKKSMAADLKEAEQELADMRGLVSGFDPDEEKATRTELARIEEKIQQRSAKLKAAKKDMTGVCPILDEPCDRISSSSKNVDAWRKEKCALESKLSGLEKKIDTFNEQRKAADRVRKAKERIADLRGAVGDLASMQASLKRLAQEKASLANKDRVPPGLDELEHRLDQLRQESKRLTGRVGELNQTLAAAKKTKAKAEDLKKSIRFLEKKKIPRLRYIAFMFGKNGIPSQEIENAFDDIEDEINLVLSKLGTALTIEFRPDREIGTWEDFCVECGWQFPKGQRSKECGNCGADRRKKRKDELQLRVLEDGEDEGFHLESGGGKTLVSIATRIAMTRLLQRQTGSNFNVIFLDEPDSAFDSVNRARFVNLITTTLTKHFGIEQIFWITHASEYKDQVPHILKVTRFDRHSETSWL